MLLQGKRTAPERQPGELPGKKYYPLMVLRRKDERPCISPLRDDFSPARVGAKAPKA